MRQPPKSAELQRTASSGDRGKGRRGADGPQHGCCWRYPAWGGCDGAGQAGAVRGSRHCFARRLSGGKVHPSPRPPPLACLGARHLMAVGRNADGIAKRGVPFPLYLSSLHACSLSRPLHALSLWTPPTCLAAPSHLRSETSRRTQAYYYLHCSFPPPTRSCSTFPETQNCLCFLSTFISYCNMTCVFSVEDSHGARVLFLSWKGPVL